MCLLYDFFESQLLWELAFFFPHPLPLPADRPVPLSFGRVGGEMENGGGYSPELAYLLAP